MVLPLPKSASYKASTFSDFYYWSLKKSSKPNGAISLHQNLPPAAINWKAGWHLQERLSDQSTPSLLRHACFPKGLSVYLPISSESNTGQQQMKGRHLANAPNCYKSSLPSFLPSPVLASCLASSLFTHVPKIWMSTGQRRWCHLWLGLPSVRHPTFFS